MIWITTCTCGYRTIHITPPSGPFKRTPGEWCPECLTDNPDVRQVDEPDSFNLNIFKRLL